METTEAFIRWSAPHWGAIMLTAVVTAGILAGGRRQSEEIKRKICRALAVVVGLIYATDSSYILFTQYHGSWEQNLPFHYCSMMLLVATYALWTRNRTACWVLYFGALTACLQGLITPALKADFPTMRFCLFFSLHGILMPAALVVPLLLGMRARLGDILRSILLMDIYLICIHPVNLLLGTNYGFTMESPVPGCILDYAGPAPWYYLILQIPAFGLFYLLHLPVRENAEAEIRLPEAEESARV